MTQTAADVAKMPFEAALAELESIVDKLEKGAVALEDSIKLYERGAALLVERHRDEGGARQADRHRIEQHHIAGDEAALLEHPHPAQAGRLRQVDAIGELGVGETAVAHQLAQDRTVAVVDVFDSHNTLQTTQLFAQAAAILQ